MHHGVESRWRQVHIPGAMPQLLEGLGEVGSLDRENSLEDHGIDTLCFRQAAPGPSMYSTLLIFDSPKESEAHDVDPARGLARDFRGLPHGGAPLQSRGRMARHSFSAASCRKRM